MQCIICMSVQLNILCPICINLQYAQNCIEFDNECLLLWERTRTRFTTVFRTTTSCSSRTERHARHSSHCRLRAWTDQLKQVLIDSWAQRSQDTLNRAIDQLPKDWRLLSKQRVVITRHSLVGRGICFTVCFLFVFIVNDFSTTRGADSRQILHAGVLWFRMCLPPFWGLAVPGGGRKGNEISWKTYVECGWRVCDSSTDAIVLNFVWSLD